MNPMTLNDALAAADLPAKEYAKILRKTLRDRNAPKVSVTVGRGTVSTTVYIRLARHAFDTYEESEAAAERLAFIMGWTNGYAPFDYIVYGRYDRIFYLLAASGWWHDDIELVHPKPVPSIHDAWGV